MTCRKSPKGVAHRFLRSTRHSRSVNGKTRAPRSHSVCCTQAGRASCVEAHGADEALTWFGIAIVRSGIEASEGSGNQDGEKAGAEQAFREGNVSSSAFAGGPDPVCQRQLAWELQARKAAQCRARQFSHPKLLSGSMRLEALLGRTQPLQTDRSESGGCAA